ncbi:MAG: transcription termination/antitermination factor NusG, partial [Ruminococcaceae bacterium]|nr:transcription termination/antitermination factor NusG [Oscillospiraceae bacterium]
MVENRRIQDLVEEIRVPTETVVEIKDNKRKEMERKLFPGYVLVKMVMTDESWYIVRNIRGVTGFVGTSSRPIPLTQEEVDSLGVEKKEIRVDYSVGDSVKVVEGPLAGFIATVEEIDSEGQKVRVKVSMFGRETLAELELAEVTPI